MTKGFELTKDALHSEESHEDDESTEEEDLKGL
jgi:hypothetical protein